MILSAIRSAILRVTGVTVYEAFSSTDQVAVEMTDLVNEVATDIMKSADWRALTKVATVAGTGAQAYPLPADFDRMVIGAEIDDSASWFWGYQPFDSVNDWMRYRAGGASIVSPGGWIILGGELQFFPGALGTAQYPYISNAYARSDGGAVKSAFTADNDSFVLDDRLLTLGLIWRWQDQKGMEYAESMQTYEIALAQAQSRDKGARLLRVGGRVLRGTTAYSGRAI